jgi:hypothetical protein
MASLAPEVFKALLAVFEKSIGKTVREIGHIDVVASQPGQE